jgi:hypothetical protein
MLGFLRPVDVSRQIRVTHSNLPTRRSHTSDAAGGVTSGGDASVDANDDGASAASPSDADANGDANPNAGDASEPARVQDDRPRSQ